MQKLEKWPESYRLYERLKRERGLSDYRVAADVGTRQSTFTKWRQLGYVPKYALMSKIAVELSTPEELHTAAEFYEADIKAAAGEVS